MLLAAAFALPAGVSAEGAEGASPAGEETPASAGTSEKRIVSSPVLASVDTSFLERSTAFGTLLVRLAEIGATNASTEDLRSLGQGILDDVGKANEQIESFVTMWRVALPETLDPRYEKKIRRLERVSGERFDKTFLKLTGTFLQRDIKVFTKESEEGNDPEIRQFATATLPALTALMTRLEELRGDAPKAAAEETPEGGAEAEKSED
jgi:putative membrane protein